MRDTRKDEQYFDSCIANTRDRIKRFEQKLESGEVLPERPDIKNTQERVNVLGYFYHVSV